MTQEEIKENLALTPEQEVLLEEWNDLKERMDRANMWFLWDANNCMMAVVNYDNVEDYFNDPSEEPDSQAVEVEGEAIPWENFEFPNFTELNDGPFFIQFK